MAYPTPAKSSKASEGIKNRLLQVAEWLKLDAPPVSYEKDGSLQHDAALLAWCKAGGVCVNWVLYGDAKSMVVAQHRQYERERHFYDELKRFDPVEQPFYEVLEDFELLEPSFYELLKGFDPVEQRLLLEGLQNERNDSINDSGVVFQFILNMIAYRKSPTNPQGRRPKHPPLGSDEY